MWQGWFDLVAGVWLFISAFTSDMRAPASMIAAGIVITIFGFWGAGERHSWQGSINGIIGVWLLLSGIWFNLAVSENFLISGIIVIFLAAWNIFLHSEISREPLQRKNI